MAPSPPAAARFATTAASAPAGEAAYFASTRRQAQNILDQLDDGIRRLKHRYEVDRFIAYFQPATNTYAPVERCGPSTRRRCRIPRSSAWRSARGPIACRTTCSICSQESGSARDLPCRVEYGLQTIHDRSLDWMNRGHHHDATIDAIERSRGRGFEICGHVILGLPGETHDDMLATAREVARLRLDAVKIHNLYAVKNTPLADQVARGEVTLMEPRRIHRAR